METAMKREVVFSGHQPNFLPYMGFFYKMFRSDVFVLDDDVQYSSKAWHNTNFIKVNGEKHRITVPVSYDYGAAINRVKIDYSREWSRKLLETVKMNYGKATHFNEAYDMLFRHIAPRNYTLTDLTIPLIQDIAERFGLRCRIVIASKELYTDKKNNDRNIWQCERLGGTVYFSGDGGKDYNDESAYREHGIQLVYADYKPVHYHQCGKGLFIENLSVLDYIFNCGFELPKEWVRA